MARDTTSQAEDRFSMSRNFLATDEVPESIFGIPVVADEDGWTEADLEFFRNHPEAGGYYDLGEETPEDGSAEGAPTQADAAGNAPADRGWNEEDARRRLERRRQAIMDGRIEPDAIDRQTMPGQDLDAAAKARQEYIRRERAKQGPGGRKAADKGGDAQAFMDRNPTLFAHVKASEKLRLAPYEDVGGYAIGYGAHTDADGNAVTEATPEIDAATADRMLARDLYARRERLAKTLPNWGRIPGNARQALLDVSMGKDNILSASRSKGLRADLAAAGKDSTKLLAAVKKHYYSYLTKDPKHREGLMARRIAGGKAFFGEDFSYEGKVWDPVVGFVAKTRNASGGSTRSEGER